MTETYRFYPPQRTAGTNELLDDDWRNRIHMMDEGICAS